MTPSPPPPNSSINATATERSHYLSGLEFLRTGHLSNSIVLLRQEDNPTTYAPPAGPNSSSCGDDNGNGRVILENTVRLALLVTRAYVDFLSQPRYLSSIPLDLGDLFIKFKHKQERTSKGKALIQPLPQELHHHQGFVSNFDGRNYDDCQNYSNTAPASVGSEDSNSTIPFTSIVTVYGVDINIFSLEIEITKGSQRQKHEHTKESQMQVLGNILYSLFCPGESPPSASDIIPKESFQTNGNRADSHDNDNDNQRSAKTLRSTEETLFSRLAQNNANLPKSICQLLSDMIHIDSGPNPNMGEYASPFTSFEEIIHDLEQMISQPQEFLHDSYSPSLQRMSQTIFGNNHHGRKEEVATLMELANGVMEQSQSQSSRNLNDGMRAAFVSGIAGSGKSYLVQAIGDDLLQSFGWIVIKAKFERSTEHASRRILSFMFDEIVRYLVKMKESKKPADVAYSQRASKSILNSIDQDTLYGMVDFLPSLPLLFDDSFGKVERPNNNNTTQQAKESEWQLVLPLTKILKAVLESGRFLMICCDDLQWADKSTLSLISELLIDIGGNKQISPSCLFVGLYRPNEINDDHPFLFLDLYLQTSSSVDVTKIELSSLSKGDVLDMLMSEFHLPQRLVMELADMVYKKTAGHAFFVVELLNSFIRDSIITYSSEYCQYTWDIDRIQFIQTGDSVAELIASNLKSLTLESQQVLQILSCFGTQTDDSLLQLLESFQKDIVCSIDTFIEQGVLDRAGPIVIFTHDLIQQAVYESMSLDERKSLHLRVGQYLGKLAIETVADDFGQLHLKDQVFYSGRNISSTLLSIACDQVNAAGSDFSSDEHLNFQFAGWNLSAGQHWGLQSNFSGALYYYSNGIAFLGPDCWCNDAQLCLQLHHGAVFSSFALGEADKFDQYAQQVIDHVPFQFTIEVQLIVLKSLTQADQHQEAISKGLDIMRQLNFHIPLAPSKENIIDAMASTNRMASQYSSDRIISLCHGSTDDPKYTIVKIMDAFYVSAYTTGSSFVPLIACEIVKFSLQNGVCPESALSFVTFALFKMRQEDYLGGKYWADMTRIMIQSNPNKHKSSETRAECLLHATNDIFFMSPRNISSKLMSLYNDAMKIGQIDTAMMCLIQAWKFRLLGGHNLSLIVQAFKDQVKLTVHHSQYATRWFAIDSILLMELTGKRIDCFSVFGDSISSVEDLRSDAESSSDNRSLYNFDVIKMLAAYWKGHYMEAEEHFHSALAYPTAMMPQIFIIYHTFFGGLIALQLYREVGDNDGQRFKQIKQSMEKLEKWAQNSQAVFENKWLLLKAEYFASIGEHDRAKPLYKASINSAKDHGNIHELALAFELFGNSYCYAKEYVKEDCARSNECFTLACVYYKQWGATALEEKLLSKHNLKMDQGARLELRGVGPKNPRDNIWNE